MSGASRRTKVLLLIDALLPGGAERFLVGLATSLPPDRYDVCVCATRGSDGPLVDVLREAGVRYESLGRRGRYDLAPFARLMRLMRDERFDVLHAHKFGSNLWGSIFGRLSGTPVVVAHEQTWSYEGQALRRFLDGRVIGRLADTVVAVSTRDRERMTSVEGIPPERTTYIPNAYVPRSGPPPSGDLRAELGIAPDAPVAGTLCVLRRQKRIDLLIDAFAQVTSRLPDARLVIGGYGPMMDEWQAHGRARGVDERIHWLGMREDAEVVLAGLDVAVMSSEFEGTPLFAFECMAARKPLVATDVGGLRDAFDPGTSALLVPPGDAEALAEGIESLLGDPQRRASVAEAAHARLEEFTVDRAAERVGELYDRLLRSKGIELTPRTAPGAGAEPAATTRR